MSAAFPTKRCAWCAPRSTRTWPTWSATQEDADISDQELWGIEAALNRFILLCERMDDRADAAGLDECRQADAQLFVAVGEQDLAGGACPMAPRPA